MFTTDADAADYLSEYVDEFLEHFYIKAPSYDVHMLSAAVNKYLTWMNVRSTIEGDCKIEYSSAPIDYPHWEMLNHRPGYLSTFDESLIWCVKRLKGYLHSNERYDPRALRLATGLQSLLKTRLEFMNE